MSDVSAIEWTDATWNPVTGCTRVSPGCANCYIERTPPFRMAGRRFATVDGESTTGVTLHEDRLNAPLRWRKPRRVFVCSLADLFHDEIPYEYVRDVFNTMRCCDGGVAAATGRRDPSHIFQVLTKRPARVLELWRERKLGFTDWPPNVWMGVSIENARYTWRADVLREIPAAVRFISAEPLLGSLFPPTDALPDRPDPRLVSDPARADAMRADLEGRGRNRAPLDLAGIDWVIIGGESGPGARPFYLEHAREIIARRALMAGAVERLPMIFVKQLGAKPVGRGYVNQAPQGPPFHLQARDDVPLKLRDRKGGDPSEWPADLRIREFPIEATRGVTA